MRYIQFLEDRIISLKQRLQSCEAYQYRFLTKELERYKKAYAVRSKADKKIELSKDLCYAWADIRIHGETPELVESQGKNFLYFELHGYPCLYEEHPVYEEGTVPMMHFGWRRRDLEHKDSRGLNKRFDQLQRQCAQARLEDDKKRKQKETV